MENDKSKMRELSQAEQTCVGCYSLYKESFLNDGKRKYHPDCKVMKSWLKSGFNFGKSCPYLKSLRKNFAKIRRGEKVSGCTQVMRELVRRGIVDIDNIEEFFL